MFSDNFILLVTKQFAGTISTMEEAELNNLLQQPELLERYAALQKFWKQNPSQQAPDKELAFQKIIAQITDEPLQPLPVKRFSPALKWLSAVAVVLAISVSIWLFTSNRNTATTATDVAASKNKDLVEKLNTKGTRSVITLADGSKVWLNADSRLVYPSAFTGNTREIELSGEAFFEVTKNPQKPFIIHLTNGTVRVLGTSFNIKAYPGENKIETSVTTGRVAFIPATKNQKHSDSTIITPNLKAIYSLQNNVVKTIATSSAEDKAWTDGKLIFHSTGMDEIAVTLERYFGKQVVINNDEIKAYHLTGSFENNTAEEILYYLSKTKPFTYKITETQIILSLVR